MGGWTIGLQSHSGGHALRRPGSRPHAAAVVLLGGTTAPSILAGGFWPGRNPWSQAMENALGFGGQIAIASSALRPPSRTASPATLARSIPSAHWKPRQSAPTTQKIPAEKLVYRFIKTFTYYIAN